MFQIGVEGLKELTKDLNDMAKSQIPFSTSVAINKVARKAKKNVQGTMKQVFDRPTRFTLNSLQITPSHKKRLPIHAVLWFKDPVQASSREHYLAPHVHGGKREVKRFESLLIRKGLMTGGMKAIPGTSMRRNKFGNVTGGMHVKILSALKAQRDIGFTSHSKGAKARKYFALRKKHGKLIPGIYERYGRKGKQIRPAFIFTSKAVRYRKRLPFYEVVMKTVDRHMEKEFHAALAAALKTRRPSR